MSMAVDAAMEALQFLDLSAANWEELADRVKDKADDMEEWDGITNPGEDSIHYDTWLSNEEFEANRRTDSEDDGYGDLSTPDPTLEFERKVMREGR